MGINVADHSTAELADVTQQRNQQGIDVLNASLVILRGRITITDNRSHGADVNGGSVMQTRGAHVEISNNDSGSPPPTAALSSTPSRPHGAAPSQGITVGRIVCDKTVLTRGNTVCT